MSRIVILRAAALYVPLTIALLAWMMRPPAQRQAAGMLLASIWNLNALVALHLVATSLGWWHFNATSGALLGMPVEMYLGWVMLWGALPQLLFRNLALWVRITIFAAVDMAFMPMLHPVLVLGPWWMVGEAAALAVCFVPAQLLSDWTATGTRLHLRALLQFITFSMLLLFLLPSLIYWSTEHASWIRVAASYPFALQLVAFPGLLGVAALLEFVTLGGGTPFPYDPPVGLVRSGAYSYVANPMQISAMLVMLCMAAILRNFWFVAAALVAHSYGAGLAHFDEEDDLPRRFGDDYRNYQQQVRAWLPRWTPHPDATPTGILYVRYRCDICSQVGEWIARRGPTNLIIRDAAEHPRLLRRITYSLREVEFSGVEALARAMQHVNLAWAYLGWTMQLPGVKQLLQVMVDASGGGPVPLTSSENAVCQLVTEQTSVPRSVTD